MRKAFLVLAAVAMMALCVPGTVLAQDNADFDITARLGSPMTLTLDVAEIGFGTLAHGGIHAAILALNDIIVTVGGDANELYDVMFDGNITPAATNYPVTMAGPGAETFIVNIQHDSTGTLDGTGAEVFNLSAIIPSNALGLVSVPGSYAPAALVNIRVDYQ